MAALPGGASSVGTTDEMKLQLNGFVMVEPRITIFSHGCQVDRCIASSGIDLARVGWTNGVPPPPWGELGQKEYVILCALASKADLPTRLRLSVPDEIKTYGAWFDFHDIDLPVLPAPLQ